MKPAIFYSLASLIATCAYADNIFTPYSTEVSHKIQVDGISNKFSIKNHFGKPSSFVKLT